MHYYFAFSFQRGIDSFFLSKIDLRFLLLSRKSQIAYPKQKQRIVKWAPVDKIEVHVHVKKCYKRLEIMAIVSLKN